MHFFAGLEMAPADPIMGLTEQFNNDPNPQKVNLGVGMYQDENGSVPLLEAVKQAEQKNTIEAKPRKYLPIQGHPGFITETRSLVFGQDSRAVADGRIVTVQSLGGTGALRVGAQFLYKFIPQAKVLLSDPSWENHYQLFTATGFDVERYRYYDEEKGQIDFAGMISDLSTAEPGTIVVLHACCHNPTGFDLSPNQWDQVIEVIKERKLMPFLDFAYQGFGDGLTEDRQTVRRFENSGLRFLCASSFSKSMSLYGERVGSLSLVCQDSTEAPKVLSQVKPVIRTLYSNPPIHGAAAVATILHDIELRNLWITELDQMRQRIKTMRETLVAELVKAGVEKDMSFITTQRGMFSYSGLTRDQMIQLRKEYSVYGTDKGRICVAALNRANVSYVANAIASVV